MNKVIDCGNTAYDRKLAALRPSGELVLQISPRRSRVEQVDFLNTSAIGYWLSPIGVKDFGDADGNRRQRSEPVEMRKQLGE